MSVAFLQSTGIAINPKVPMAILEFKRLRSAAGCIFFFLTLKDENPFLVPRPSLLNASDLSRG
jgi:hypothetical protein